MQITSGAVRRCAIQMSKLYTTVNALEVVALKLMHALLRSTICFRTRGDPVRSVLRALTAPLPSPAAVYFLLLCFSADAWLRLRIFNSNIESPHCSQHCCTRVQEPLKRLIVGSKNRSDHNDSIHCLNRSPSWLQLQRL